MRRRFELFSAFSEAGDMFVCGRRFPYVDEILRTVEFGIAPTLRFPIELDPGEKGAGYIAAPETNAGDKGAIDTGTREAGDGDNGAGNK